MGTLKVKMVVLFKGLISSIEIPVFKNFYITNEGFVLDDADVSFRGSFKCRKDGEVMQLLSIGFSDGESASGNFLPMAHKNTINVNQSDAIHTIEFITEGIMLGMEEVPSKGEDMTKKRMNFGEIVSRRIEQKAANQMVDGFMGRGNNSGNDLLKTMMIMQMLGNNNGGGLFGQNKQDNDSTTENKQDNN